MRYHTKKRAALERKIRNAKKEIVKARDHYCSSCGTTSDRIDCSHIISVDKCIKEGQPELAHDPDNIVFDCRECHKIWEGASRADKMEKIGNYKDRIRYIKDKMPELYKIISLTETRSHKGKSI